MDYIRTLGVWFVVAPGLLWGQQQLGVKDGKLAPCDDRFNCVISQEVDGQKPSIKPIIYTSSRQKAMQLLKKVIEIFARVHIVIQRTNYLHVTFTSRLWKFIDDVEFYLPAEKKVIQMRSASRRGKWDLGVNKRRLKKIAKLFYALQ